MSKQVYTICFMALALSFVPIFLFFGLGWSITPCSYQAYFIINHIHLNLPSLFLKVVRAGYVAVYWAIFYFCAVQSFRLLSKISQRGIKLVLQLTILLALFSCSFLNVICKESITGPSGTYNFWTACTQVVKAQTVFGQ